MHDSIYVLERTIVFETLFLESSSRLARESEIHSFRSRVVSFFSPASSPSVDVRTVPRKRKEFVRDYRQLTFSQSSEKVKWRTLISSYCTKSREAQHSVGGLIKIKQFVSVWALHSLCRCVTHPIFHYYYYHEEVLLCRWGTCTSGQCRCLCKDEVCT